MGGKRSWRRLRAGHAWLKEAKRCRDNGRCPRPLNPCLLVARSHRLERALKVYGIGVKAQSGSRPSRGQRKGWMIGEERRGPSGVVMASEIKMMMSMTPKHVFIHTRPASTTRSSASTGAHRDIMWTDQLTIICGSGHIISITLRILGFSRASLSTWAQPASTVLVPWTLLVPLTSKANLAVFSLMPSIRSWATRSDDIDRRVFWWLFVAECYADIGPVPNVIRGCCRIRRDGANIPLTEDADQYSDPSGCASC